MHWPIIGVLLLAALSACSDSHTSLEDRVFSGVADAWQAADLRDPFDDSHTSLEDFHIEVKATVQAFELSCPKQWYKGKLVSANACLRWRNAPGKVRSILYPVAVISPLLAPDRHAAAAIHELCHAFRLAAYRSADPYHMDGRVFGPDAGSVEEVAERAVYGLPEPE